MSLKYHVIQLGAIRIGAVYVYHITQCLLWCSKKAHAGRASLEVQACYELVPQTASAVTLPVRGRLNRSWRRGGRGRRAWRLEGRARRRQESRCTVCPATNTSAVGGRSCVATVLAFHRKQHNANISCLCLFR